MNKAMKVLLFATIAMLVSSGYAELVYDQNFDDNNDWWTTSLTGDTAATYIMDGIAGNTTHSGTGALSISSPDGVERWYMHHNGSLTISITPEHEYELSAWVKTENMSDNTSTYIRFAWRDSDKIWLGNSSSSTSITTNGDWTQLTLTTTAPLNAVGAQVYLFVEGDAASTATITFDDIQINAVPEPATLGLFSISGCLLMALRRLKI